MITFILTFHQEEFIIELTFLNNTRTMYSYCRYIDQYIHDLTTFNKLYKMIHMNNQIISLIVPTLDLTTSNKYYINVV